MASTTNGRRTLAQTVGLVFGITYILVGLVGFAVTAGVGFADNDGNRLLGLFEINPLHNLVHLAIGAMLTWGALRNAMAARAMNTTVGATYLLVGVIGLFIANGDNDANILALNGADNVLHLGSGLLLLASAMRSEDTETRSDTTADSRGRTTTGSR